MGIDRHEWEHRNYKSGRDKAAPVVLSDEDPLAVDVLLGDAPLQPETSEGKPKEKAKASVKAASKDNSKDNAKDNSKTTAKAKSGGKRSARAG